MTRKSRKRAIRAWVIRWEWAGTHAAVEQPIAAILPSRWGVDNVKRIIEALYAAREFDPIDMLHAARAYRDAPYRAHNGTAPVILEDGTRSHVEWAGEILCGHNPYLVARQAHVWQNDSRDVEWEDIPRPSLDLRGNSFCDAAPLEPPAEG